MSTLKCKYCVKLEMGIATRIQTYNYLVHKQRVNHLARPGRFLEEEVYLWWTGGVQDNVDKWNCVHVRS